MGLISEINDSQFNELVLSSSRPALVMCTSPECIICKTMHERLKEVASEQKFKIDFLSLDVNKNKIWEKFDVRAIPTLLYFKDGMLSGCQDTFPDKKEISDKIKDLIKQQGNFIPELKKSIEAEYLMARFYRYLSNETKNGHARKVFTKMNKESESHRKLLEDKFKELTGQPVETDVRKYESEGLAPANFSLIGAVKMAIKTEEDAFKFYKLASKKAPKNLQPVFKQLIKEETKHFRALKQELQFLKGREEDSLLQAVGYGRWIQRIFR